MKIKLIKDLSNINPNLSYGRTIEVELKDDGVYFGNTHINDLYYYWVNPSREDKKKIDEYYDSQKQPTYTPTRRTIEVPEGVKKVVFVYEE